MIARVWGTFQHDLSYPAGLTSDDQALGIGSFYQKVIDCDGDDSPVFMGHFDPPRRDAQGVIDYLGHPNDIDEVLARAAIYRAQGIHMVPWGVSRGVHPREEGELAGRVASALGTPYLLDLEDEQPYYWRGDAQAVGLWLEGFRQHHGELWVAPDARAGHPGIHLREWVRQGGHTITRWLPQAYWPAFQQRWMTGISEAYLPIQEALVDLLHLTTEEAVARIHPVFAGDSPTAELLEALRWSQQWPPFGGFSLFHRGNVPLATYEALKDLPEFLGGSETPAPTPTPEPVPALAKDLVLSQLALAQGAIDVARQLVERL